jgi:hypothetical protein
MQLPHSPRRDVGGTTGAEVVTVKPRVATLPARSVRATAPVHTPGA